MKNKKILIIIGIVLIVIGIVCFCLFVPFGKNEKVNPAPNNGEDKEEVEVKEGYDEFGNKLVVVYETKDEVRDVIVNEYLKKGETIVSEREEDGCWYYKISNGTEEYFYCIDDPIIRVSETTTITIN